MPAPTTPVVEVRGLTVALPAGADRSHAVEDVDLSVNAGDSLPRWRIRIWKIRYRPGGYGHAATRPQHLSRRDLG